VADELDVVVGVDTHKHTHTAAVLRPSGAVVDHLSAAADPKGYRRLVAFGRRHGDRRLWAVEGTGSFGAGLCAALLAGGETVVEVDRPQRRLVGPAPRAMRSTPCGRPARHWPGSGSASRALVVTEKQSASCSPPVPRPSSSAPGQSAPCTRWPPPPPIVSVTGCAACRWESSSPLAPRCVGRPARPARSSPRRWRCAPPRRVPRLPGRSRRARDPARRLGPTGRTVTARSCRHRTGGRRTDHPSWSHRGRVRSEAAFARLAGVAPIEASSGTVTRHRLNRCGDRQLNRALHTIVLVRMRHDPTTQGYVTRRLAEGKSVREIKRCLKRYVARQLFRHLESSPSTT
jgi:transposase